MFSCFLSRKLYQVFSVLSKLFHDGRTGRKRLVDCSLGILRAGREGDGSQPWYKISQRLPWRENIFHQRGRGEETIYCHELFWTNFYQDWIYGYLAKDKEVQGFVPKTFVRRVVPRDEITNKTKTIIRDLYQIRRNVWLEGKEATTK